MPDYPNFSTTETINTKNLKNKLVEFYIQALSEEKLPWERGWNNVRERHYNPVTNMTYHGNNFAILEFVSMIKGYEDPRWCTIKQANSQKWKIKPKPEEVRESGEIYGVPLKYWMPCELDEHNKFVKWISWDEYNAWKTDENDKRIIDVRSKTFYVYNAKEIEGIPELEKEVEHEINSAPFIDNLIEKMNVKYLEGGNQAFYNYGIDTVVVPNKHQFKSDYEYNSTRLHELCHATGHGSRLDRTLANTFGTQEYAKEELRAEIASSFLSQDIGLPASEQNLKNHSAYIQNWISVLKKDPNELFKAIKSADEIEKYTLKVGEWDRFVEIEKQKNNESISIDGYIGTWHLIDAKEMNNEKYYMYEHDEYGDHTAFVITDKDLNPVTETMDGIEIALEEYFDGLDLEQEEQEI